jgi:hypothetical protein
MAVAAAVLILPLTAVGQHGWPIEPTNADHPMGNSFGEYEGDLHTGIDIMEPPMYDSVGVEDPAAPWVAVTVAGTINRFEDDASSLYNFTAVDADDPADPAVYDYGHLEHGSYHVDYEDAYNDGNPVAAGDRIAKIVRWGNCDFHHLHHEIQIPGGNFISPLADITPNPDPDPPEVDGLYVAQNNTNPWVAFNPVAGSACTVVSGLADIIVKTRDFDDAGSSLGDILILGFHDVRWRACPDSDPDCPWIGTHRFDTTPSGTATLASRFFSSASPWQSYSGYCGDGWYYPVVTNFVAGAADTAGAWDTAAAGDDSYSVSAEVSDFAGNTTVISRRACVQNTATCTAELVVRDATDDLGGIPYPGSNWWLSPDITANPGTPDQDVNINLDTPNPIDVRVWNYGSCDLVAGTTYDVCLGWGLPSGSVAHPLPAAQQIGCQTETVAAGGWAVGSSQTTTFTWTPASATVPDGHHCLIAWVDMPPDDSVQNTASVKWDDNRAQQNITFTPAPGPGDSVSSSFWIIPQRMFKKRDVELTLRYSGNRPTLSKVRLHVGPGLAVDNIIGGVLVGGYRGDKVVEPCELKPDELHRLMCSPWQESAKGGYTRVIDGFGPTGNLVLEGVRVMGEPVRVKVEVWTAEGAKKSDIADVEVVEHAILPGHERATEVGGLTVRFVH